MNQEITRRGIPGGRGSYADKRPMKRRRDISERDVPSHSQFALDRLLVLFRSQALGSVSQQSG
jgi:hypothetical protein